MEGVEMAMDDTMMDLIPAAGSRVLVVGREDLALEANRRGCTTAFIPDRPFARHYDAADPNYAGLVDGGDWSKLDSTGFRARLTALETMGIAHPGLGLTSFHGAIGALNVRHRPRPSWHFETWHAVLVDTTDPWMHPSWTSCMLAARGDDFSDIRALARLPVPGGGIFAFRHLPYSSSPAAGALGDGDWPDQWRAEADWPQFLAPYFATVLERAGAAAGRVLIATRTNRLTEGDEMDWFQPG